MIRRSLCSLFPLGLIALGLFVLGLIALGAALAGAEDQPPADGAPWQSLFDGRSLSGWTVTNFGGEGEVAVREGRIEIEMGNNMSGITCTRKDLPQTNYELSLEAMRLDGNDFFCGLTFPVGDSWCSLICGGWGGTVVGLSSIDGDDASENQTTSYMAFDNDRWYRVRVRVTPGKIDCWIDQEHVVDLETADKRIGIRSECDLSKPLGIANWITTTALRDIKIRKLSTPPAKAE